MGRREEGDGVVEREFSDGKVGREDERAESGNSWNEELAGRRGGPDHALR